MSTTHICDHCGEPIGPTGDPYVYVIGMSVGQTSRFAFDAARRFNLHFHARSGRDCMEAWTEARREPLTPNLGEQSNVRPATITEADRDRWSAWKRTPVHLRQRWALEALGDEGLTTRELAERLEKPEMMVHYPDVYVLMTKHLQPAGEVKRVDEPWTRSKTRARWYRNATLTGPIADLQKALKEEDA